MSFDESAGVGGVGIYGAKVQSWRAANPRDLLKRLIDENPGSDRAGLLSLLRGQLKGDDAQDYLDSIIEYWFSNNYHSLVGPAALTPETVRRESAKLDERVKQAIKTAAVRMVLMDLVLPNGKELRDCNAKDCKKAGGWLAKVASKLKPGQLVGQALSEKELRSLYR